MFGIDDNRWTWEGGLSIACVYIYIYIMMCIFICMIHGLSIYQVYTTGIGDPATHIIILWAGIVYKWNVNQADSPSQMPGERWGRGAWRLRGARNHMEILGISGYFSWKKSWKSWVFREIMEEMLICYFFRLRCDFSLLIPMNFLWSRVPSSAEVCRFVWKWVPLDPGE